MLFYFSATGNSQWIALQLASLTGDEVCSITDFIKNKSVPALPTGTARVGFVFPIHSWYVPAPVLQFLSQLASPASAYRYAICTCGDDVGKGLSRLSRHFPLDAAWSIQMPNTYVPMFKLDPPALAQQKVETAQQQLPRIASAVKRKEHVWEVHEGSWPWCKTYVVYPLFKNFCISIKAFQADDTCISCGRCEQHCPVSAIRLVNGHPTWNNACIHCMACLHGCPTHAICYGKGTKGKGQYHLEDYINDER